MEFYLLTLSVVPLFVSRAMLPLFATACFARFGADWDVGWLGFFEEFTAIDLLDAVPVWAVRDEVLIILGIGTALELLVRHIPETRVLVDGASNNVLKGIAAGCCAYLLAGGNLGEILEIWLKTGDFTQFQSGLGFQYSWSFLLGAVVCFLSFCRSLIWDFLDQLDPDGELGITSSFVWIEDTVGFVGFFFALFLPGLCAFLALVTGVAVWLLGVAARRVERRAEVACGRCGTLGPRCGPHCGTCHAPRASVCGVGLLGLVQSTPAGPAEAHRIALVAHHRCPHCGTRAGRGHHKWNCRACQRPILDPTLREAYLHAMAAQISPILWIGALCGAVPLLGLVPGYLYYQLSPVAGVKFYMPATDNLLRRWLLRFVKLFALSLQWVPFLGMATLPVVCWLDFQMARAGVARLSLSPGSTLSPVSPPAPGIPVA